MPATCADTCSTPSNTAPDKPLGIKVPSDKYRRSAKTSRQNDKPLRSAATSIALPARPYSHRDGSYRKTASAMASAVAPSPAARLYKAPCGFTWCRERPSERTIAAKAPVWYNTVSYTSSAVNAIARRPKPDRSG